VEALKSNSGGRNAWLTGSLCLIWHCCVASLRACYCGGDDDNWGSEEARMGRRRWTSLAVAWCLCVRFFFLFSLSQRSSVLPSPCVALGLEKGVVLNIDLFRTAIEEHLFGDHSHTLLVPYVVKLSLMLISFCNNSHCCLLQQLMEFTALMLVFAGG